MLIQQQSWGNDQFLLFSRDMGKEDCTKRLLGEGRAVTGWGGRRPSDMRSCVFGKDLTCVSRRGFRVLRGQDLSGNRNLPVR